MQREHAIIQLRVVKQATAVSKEVLEVKPAVKLDTSAEGRANAADWIKPAEGPAPSPEAGSMCTAHINLTKWTLPPMKLMNEDSD